MPAIHGNVLAGQIAGMDRAEERTDLPELLGGAEPLGRNFGGKPCPTLFIADVRVESPFQPVGIQLAR